MTSPATTAEAATLRRRLGLPLLVLYGTGITVGAGIYVLVGAVAGSAGMYAPWSFLLAGIVMGLTVASYAELSTRYPVSAGEAAYVRAAFGRRSLSTAVGSLTIVIAIVSSAAVALGAAGYIAQFVAAPRWLVVAVVVLAMTAFAAWGILESVVLASVFTVIEIAGLIAIVAAAAYAGLPLTLEVPTAASTPALIGIAFGSLLAFFAFIGFEDLANVVEEAIEPQRDIPLAMILTLVISTILYVLIAVIAVSALPIETLKSSPAPLAMIFRQLTGANPAVISAIAIFATLNTILAQMTMAARVVYGMAKQGDLPPHLAAVDPRTATPVVATALVAAAVLVLALLVPFEALAEWTSIATLLVFALVNLALVAIRRRGDPGPAGYTRVPLWMPILGFVASLAMIAAAFVG